MGQDVKALQNLRFVIENMRLSGFSGRLTPETIRDEYKAGRMSRQLMERLLRAARRNGQLELRAHVTRQGTVIIQGPLIRGKYVVLELHQDGHAETIFFGVSKP